MVCVLLFTLHSSPKENETFIKVPFSGSTLSKLMTVDEGQKPRRTSKNGQIKVASPLEKCVHPKTKHSNQKEFDAVSIKKTCQTLKPYIVY